VDYPTRHGWRNILWIIVDFFNERKKVKMGCEAAYRLIMSETSEFAPPSKIEELDLTLPSTSTSESNRSSARSSEKETLPVGYDGDAAFASSSEVNYGSSFQKLPLQIAKSRNTFYEEILPKLRTARALALGDRKPTEDEVANPPKTEVELREERMRKERRWRGDEEAWAWLRSGSGVVWDDRFGAGALRVFREPSPQLEERMNSKREESERKKKIEGVDETDISS
jgi:import inner membrane translocase subunit TIM54